MGETEKERGKAKGSVTETVEEKRIERRQGPGSILHTVSTGQQGHRAKELQTGRLKLRAQSASPHNTRQIRLQVSHGDLVATESS